MSPDFVNLVQFVVSIIPRIWLNLFCFFEVRGLENLKDLKKEDGLLIVANHNSQTDSILIPCAFPIIGHHLTPIYQVSLPRKEYSSYSFGRYVYGGRFFEALGGIPAFKGLRNYEKSLRLHIKAMKDHKVLSIYPEGKRINKGVLGPIKGGVGYLASEMKPLIIPLAIAGNEGLSIWQWIFTRPHIVMEFGKPIRYEDVPNLPAESGKTSDPGKYYKDNAAAIMHLVAPMYSRLLRELA